MKCPSCGYDNPENSKFCEQCGVQLIRKCPKCGLEVSPTARFCKECGQSLLEEPNQPTKPASKELTSFAGGRYQVKKFLGEGGKKKVYLAHDTMIDRDIAFYLIKTEKMDEAGRTRIKREAKAMGKLGDHPNIVTIFDFGDHEGQPYMVAPLMPGDVEKLIEKAPDHKLPLDKVLEIVKSVCKGLEFAHAKGIIHRDIKPGNVLISADGTAKVGDFGLAVAVDLSRLTQEGMMVGTPSYMSPEQALGGEVTAKADLYSLGAMLYEMITGRPPFVGDDYVPIITQHINTPPVLPTWHRADLTPALETLIMQLLEKDPEKRPGSATVVLQALESITAGKVKEESVQKATPAENPLYRRIFVGRENELKQLQSAFDGAMSGQGALVMVVGEPGIGKTAICEQLGTFVTLRGGKTLWGHCYEEGSLSLPYLAFVEAIRSYVLNREADDLKKELGSGATDVARIVSEIREKLHIEPREAQNPEEDRYRLMQSVTSFLTHAAAVKPMLVVLEDLHDADKGTLEMLTYVSRNLSGARLLIIGSYRDVEVDRTHPLSAALAELRRVSTFSRVILRGLNIDEVRRMLSNITQEEIPVSLAEAVHRQTEGNPLFVQEVVRYLTEEKLLTRSSDKISTVSATSLEMNIPEGLRDVIGKRLSLLSQECNQLLTIAAVIGREFRLDVIQKVSRFSDEELFSLLEEARRAAIIEERAKVGTGVTYRFTHAFFRQTLYEETIAPRRIRLHLQIGQALEEIYSKNLEEHASELADHFSHSSDSADLGKAVKYGEMAAERAIDVYAFGEAVRLLDQAMKVQKVLNQDDKVKICDLLLELCEALCVVPDTKRVLEIEAPTAFAVADSLGDDVRVVRVCRIAIQTILYDQGTAGYATPLFEEWALRADRYARPDSIERAIADYALGMMKTIKLDRRNGARLLERSINLSRELHDPEVFLLSASMIVGYRTGPQHIEENIRIAEEVLANSQYKYYLNRGKIESIHLVHTFLLVGQRQRAEEVWRDTQVIFNRLGVPILYIDMVLAVMDGRIEEELELATKARTYGIQVGTSAIVNLVTFHSDLRARILLGISLDDLETVPGASYERNVYLCLIQAHQGRKEEASKGLDELVVKRPDIGTNEDESPSWAEVVLLEASVLVGHRRAAELLLDHLSDTSVRTSGRMLPTCTARHLGGAAALLGRYEEAREHYKTSFRVCTEMGFRPELALTRLQLAELLLEHYPQEKKEALEHLDFAIKEFREMKMQPSLERALRRKDILKA